MRKSGEKKPEAGQAQDLLRVECQAHPLCRYNDDQKEDPERNVVLQTSRLVGRASIRLNRVKSTTEELYVTEKWNDVINKYTRYPAFSAEVQDEDNKDYYHNITGRCRTLLGANASCPQKARHPPHSRDISSR